MIGNFTVGQEYLNRPPHIKFGSESELIRNVDGGFTITACAPLKIASGMQETTFQQIKLGRAPVSPVAAMHPSGAIAKLTISLAWPVIYRCLCSNGE